MLLKLQEHVSSNSKMRDEFSTISELWTFEVWEQIHASVRTFEMFYCQKYHNNNMEDYLMCVGFVGKQPSMSTDVHDVDIFLILVEEV